MSDNIKTFNRLLTRAVGILYNQHPRPTTLGPIDLWNPSPKPADPDFQLKTQEGNGTLMWLQRNGFVDGDLQDFGNGAMLAINNAMLTARGYQIANATDNNAEPGKTIGQVAVEAMAAPTSGAGVAGIELVARRFTSAA